VDTRTTRTIPGMMAGLLTWATNYLPLVNNGEAFRAPGGQVNGRTIDRSVARRGRYRRNVQGTSWLRCEIRGRVNDIVPLAATVAGVIRQRRDGSRPWRRLACTCTPYSVDKVVPTCRDLSRACRFLRRNHRRARLSATNWSCGAPVWGDLNDLGFDWNAEQWDQCWSAEDVYAAAVSGWLPSGRAGRNRNHVYVGIGDMNATGSLLRRHQPVRAGTAESVQYQLAYPDCLLVRGDINGDGASTLRISIRCVALTNALSSRCSSIVPRQIQVSRPACARGVAGGLLD